MEPTRRHVIGVGASLLAVGSAGCTGTGGDGDGDGGGMTDTDTPTSSPTGTPTDSPEPAASVTIDAAAHDELGSILVDGEGMTLYMFENDTNGAGESTCGGGCADAWPPVTVERADAVSATDDVGAELGTFERANGTLQVTAAGWPLYYFSSDGSPGDAKGQGVNDVWWVLRPDGTVVEPELQVRSHDEHGDILTDADGMTLYMFDNDTQGAGESTCSGGCADAWPPFTVEGEATAAADVKAEVTTFERESGDTQVAAAGWPLYYYSSDEEPGDAKGQGVNDVWWVLGPDGTPKRPESSPTTTGDDDPY